jgi:hypothetical protein
METLKDIFTSKKMVAFYWTTLNGFIGVLVLVLADLNIAYAPMIIAGLNMLSKYLNVEILQGRRS